MRGLTVHCFICFFLFASAHSFPTVAQEETSEIRRSDFPDGFIFGAAVSAYQTEGAWNVDGKGVSNWDNFTHTPGKEYHGATGDVANDYYHRYSTDNDLMKSFGIAALRVSISWSRILPKGKFGEINYRGVAFYNRLIDDLLAKGIEPFVTINHDDIPHELEDRYGSWLNPLMQEDYVLYAKTCFQMFGDRVKNWFTVNEVNLFAQQAYMNGKYPPAHCSPPFGNCSAGNSNVEPLIALHNILIAHAKAVAEYRQHFKEKQGGSLGIILDAAFYVPLRDNNADREAVKRVLAFNIGWVLDPIMYGHYPNEMRHILGNSLPNFTAEEVEYLKGSIDYICINHYSTVYAKDCLYSPCSDTANQSISGFLATTGLRDDGILIGKPTATPNCFVTPWGFEMLLNYLKNKYNNFPVIVTENGYAYEKMDSDLSKELIFNDIERINYHKGYMSYMLRAIRNGANVRGYFIWTLIDDFEWCDGYSHGFGLFYINRTTLERTPKHSAVWFSNFLADNNSIVLDSPKSYTL